VHENGERYRGGFVQGRRHGHGVTTLADGSQYSGGFVSSQRHGYGATQNYPELS
jgi:hypothetical protein